MIRTTVALPVWNSKRIAWLAMESLCRQNKPLYGWELIIFEGTHETQCGKDFFIEYELRLKAVGCENILYITSDKRFPLSQKWVRIALNSSPTSESFVLCAADNYYHPYMLIEAEAAIITSPWSVTPKGYFYDFHSGKIVLYQYNGTVGLQMIAKTELVRGFPLDEVYSGVDGWFFNRMRDAGIKTCLLLTSENWKNILCTNGLNNISKSRHQWINQAKPPFYKTEAVLEEIVPEDICIRIRNISEQLKINDDFAR